MSLCSKHETHALKDSGTVQLQILFNIQLILHQKNI